MSVDNPLEISVRDQLQGELPMETDLSRLFALWAFGLTDATARWIGRPAASFLYAAEPHKTYRTPLTRPSGPQRAGRRPPGTQLG